MQQHIAHVATSSGADVAYAVVGQEDRVIVHVPGWLGHLERGWELPEERSFYEGLAHGARLVRYDQAGCGLSVERASGDTGMNPGDDEGPPPVASLAFELEQLDAVASVAGPEPFDLVGVSLGAPVAAAWAAAHPGRVRSPVLYGGWVSGAAVASPGVREHLLGLLEAHWGLGSDVLTDVFAPDAGADLRAAVGQYQRASSTASTARALLGLSYDLDIRGLLADVRAPTLVVHREHDRAAPLAQAEALAAAIPGARLVVLPGRSHLPFVGDTIALVSTIRRFLGLRALRGGGGMLTPRQREVAALIADGCTNREIAAALGIDERSAEGHVERILDRLGFRSRAQIAAWSAGRRGGD